MVVASGRHERRGAGNERHELEPEHVAIEAQATLQVPDVQVQVADRQPGTGVLARFLACDGGQQAVKIQGLRAAGILQWLGPPRGRSVASSMPLPSGSGR